MRLDGDSAHSEDSLNQQFEGKDGHNIDGWSGQSIASEASITSQQKQDGADNTEFMNQQED